MLNEERTVRLSKTKGPAIGCDPIVLRRGEKGQTRIVAKVPQDGADWLLNGTASASFCAVLPNGAVIKDSYHTDFSRAGSASNSLKATFEYIVQDDLTSVAGNVRLAYFEVTTQTENITTDCIPIYVLENVDMTEDQAAAYKSTADVLLEELRKTVNGAKASLDTVASDAKFAANVANAATDRMTQLSESITSAEAARVTAENARVTAENTRKSNETARASAESARVSEWQTIKNESETLADDLMSKFTVETVDNTTAIAAINQLF